ncbi:hypothetical protein [Streptomyces gilvus]|uniref:hypothetical protein n=1 Tax=Streptomyces gilvus TaxID=2920937 RepID=UPI001F107AB2|nr:hypothetical protein [Streptomyces sp. CME 23]MCH5670593.1 hypothetical protein [Streptomyces sp. CME 23]
MRRSIAACGCLLLLLAACGVPGGEKSVGPGLSQADLRASIIDDRKQLFDGSLSYAPSVSVPVGGSLRFDVVLTARGEKSRRVARTAVQTRVFRVGGMQGARLTPDSREVRTVLLSEARQPIARPGESALWEWSVSADEPGDYELGLTVVTYQSDTDRALETLNPPIHVRVTVRDTWSHRFSSMQDWLFTAAGIAGALAGIYALRAPLAELVRGRREARKQREESRDGYL